MRQFKPGDVLQLNQTAPRVGGDIPEGTLVKVASVIRDGQNQGISVYEYGIPEPRWISSDFNVWRYDFVLHEEPEPLSG